MAAPDAEQPLLLLEEGVGVEEDQQEELPPLPLSSMSTTSFNILNNMVGSGLLSIPWCLKQLDTSSSAEASALTGGLVLATVGFLCWATFALVGVVCEQHQHHAGGGITSFEELAGVAGLPKRAVKYGLAVYTWLSCLSFVLLSCDFLAGENGLVYFIEGKIGDGDSALLYRVVSVFEHRSAVVCLLLALVLLPCSRFKDLSSLKPVSILSFLAMLFMVFVSVYKFTTTDREDDAAAPTVSSSDKPPATVWEGLFLAHPIFLISFTAHYNAPKFYSELEQPTARRFAVASSAAVAGALAIYATFGAVSYCTFASRTAVNVLTNYSASSALAVVARFAMLIVVLTTYPLVFQAMKSCLYKDSSSSSWMVDSALVVSTAVPAAVVTNIGLVLDYKGSVLGGVVSLLIPSLAYLAVLKQRRSSQEDVDDNDKQRWRSECQRAGALLVAGWALMCSLGGFITTTTKLLEE